MYVCRNYKLVNTNKCEAMVI